MCELGDKLARDGETCGSTAIIGRQEGHLQELFRQRERPEFVLLPDDTALIADGADTTRVVLRMNDPYGEIRPFANDAFVLELDGPATLIGDNPATLIGGAVAVWVRAGEKAGTVTLRAKHTRLGTKEVSFTLKAAEPEQV